MTTEQKSQTSQRRVALYCRISSDGQSTSMQLDALRRLAEQRGWSIAGEYSDTASGAKDRRPALDRLMSAVRSRQIDIVCAWALDRLSRSLAHLLRVAEELRSNGVDLCIATQPIDTTTATGTLVFQILGAVGDFERQLIKSRVSAGVQRVIKSGRAWGRPRRVTPVLAKKARELRQSGKSWREVSMHVGVPVRTIRRALAEPQAS